MEKTTQSSVWDLSIVYSNEYMSMNFGPIA